MIGHYKRSKFQAERCAQQFASEGLPLVIVNPSTPVGDLDLKPTPTGQIIVDYLNGRMPAYVDTGLNLIDVRDVAAGHLLADQRGAVGRRYILGNQNVSLKEMLDMLAEITGGPTVRLRLPHWIPLAVGALSTGVARLTRGEPRVSLESVRMSQKRMHFDSSRAHQEIGLPSSSVPAALERAVAWFRDHGYCDA